MIGQRLPGWIGADIGLEFSLLVSSLVSLNIAPNLVSSNLPTSFLKSYGVFNLPLLALLLLSCSPKNKEALKEPVACWKNIPGVFVILVI